MSQYPILYLPDTSPIWGSDVGASAEPTSNIIKQRGFAIGNRSSSKWHNWLLNLQNQYINLLGDSQLANWYELDRQADDLGTDDIIGVIYAPFVAGGTWFCNSASSIYASQTLRYWTKVYDLTGTGLVAVNPHCWALSSTEVLFVCQDLSGAVLLRSTDGTSWSSSAISGITDESQGIMTRYPDISDFLGLYVSDSTILRIEDISTWTAPTTPPSSVSELHQPLWLYGSTWVVLSGQGTGDVLIFRSLDNGDTWDTGTLIITNPSAGHRGLAYNPTSNRLCFFTLRLSGNRDPFIKYSDDLGYNWNFATVSQDSRIYQTTIDAHLYFCGGGKWIAVSSVPNSGRSNIYISLDDAETWTVANIFSINNAGTKTLSNIKSVGCNGRHLLAVGNDGIFYKSLALANGLQEMSY